MEKLLGKLRKLQIKLIFLGMAHSDVKPENIAVKFLGMDLETCKMKLFLIDWDHAVPFGKQRKCATKPLNITEGVNDGICDHKTDQQGFDLTFDFLL